MVGVEQGTLGGRRARFLYRIVFLASIPLSNLGANLWLQRRELLNLSPRRLGRLALVAGLGLATLPLRLWERMRWARAGRAPIDEAPLFILGHWRSGTTYLHALLAQDRRFGFVTMLQACFPDLFLTLGPWLRRRFPLPERRPVDAVRWSLDSPQEEEIPLSKQVPHAFFALLLTPKAMESRFVESVLLRGLEESALRRWRRAYLRLLRKASFRARGRRLLLKNPANTGRLALMLELFPAARFVHVHRDPYAVFSSMRSFYEMLFDLLGLQDLDRGGVERLVLAGYRELMTAYLAERSWIPPGRVVEVAYEELVERPLETAERLYRDLALGDFDRVRPAVQSFLGDQAGYAPARHELTAAERLVVEREWSFAFDHFGYRRLSAPSVMVADG